MELVKQVKTEIHICSYCGTEVYGIVEAGGTLMRCDNCFAKWRLFSARNAEERALKP